MYRKIVYHVYTRLPRECFPRDMRHYDVYYAFISRRELAYAPELPRHDAAIACDGIFAFDCY